MKYIKFPFPDSFQVMWLSEISVTNLIKSGTFFCKTVCTWKLNSNTFAGSSCTTLTLQLFNDTKTRRCGNRWSAQHSLSADKRGGHTGCRTLSWRWLVEQIKKTPTHSAWTLPQHTHRHTDTPTAGVVQLTVAVVEVHLLLFGVLLCFAVAAAPEREETRQRYHGDTMHLLLTITYIATRRYTSHALFPFLCHFSQRGKC